MIILFTLIAFSSCVKKVNSEGTVYSKSGKPVPYAVVTLLLYTSGTDTPLDSRYRTTAGADGHFRFSEMIAKNRSFGLDVVEGKEWFHKEHLSREDLKHYNIHLN
ncbi:MAG: carboxypeptidase-like regulatory domain-containing protein [Bacteroidota bacterium]